MSRIANDPNYANKLANAFAYGLALRASISVSLEALNESWMLWTWLKSTPFTWPGALQAEGKKA